MWKKGAAAVLICAIAVLFAACPTNAAETSEVALQDGVSFTMTPVQGDNLEAFDIGVHEVTWAEYRLFLNEGIAILREQTPRRDGDFASHVYFPMPIDPDWLHGVNTDDRAPVVMVSQFAAKQYTKWLSQRTGDFYRLPTAAEWRHACAAPTPLIPEGKTAGWHCDNVPRVHDAWRGWIYSAQPVGLTVPNALGIYDMHGNAAEWVLDAFPPSDPNIAVAATPPVRWPTSLHPRTVMGYSVYDPPPIASCDYSRPSTEDWSMADVAWPKSIWWLPDATFVGFRIVRPAKAPPPHERERYWGPDVDVIRDELRHHRIYAPVGAAL